MSNTSSLVHVSTQVVGDTTYNVFALEGGKLLAVPQSQPQSSVIARRHLEHDAIAPHPITAAQPSITAYAQHIDQLSDYRPRYIDPPLVRMDNLTRNILLALGGFLAVCIGVWLVKPVPIQPPPRYPTYSRECRSGGMFGWGEVCSERREYTY